MSRAARSAAALLALAALASACGGGAEGPPAAPSPEATLEAASPGATPAQQGFPVTLTDDEGVEVTLAEAPQRIITFAPSQTEIVFALGLGDRVIGVSGEFDDYPPAAREIERVGGAGEFGVDPNEERVVELQPDLMLSAFLGGEWKERLRGLGIPVFTTIATGFEDALADIETVGALTGAAEAARALTAEMRAEAAAVEAAVGTEGPVTCFFEVGFNGGFFTVGPGAIEYELLERAGCDPVTADAGEPYPQWSVEALVEDDPDVYLVAEESGGTPRAVARRPGFADLSAVREGRVVLVDSDLVSRPGPRLVEGLAALAGALHPGAL